MAKKYEHIEEYKPQFSKLWDFLAFCMDEKTTAKQIIQTTKQFKDEFESDIAVAIIAETERKKGV